MHAHPDEAAAIHELNEAFGAWGWSRALERCETTRRSIETAEGTRHLAFTSATVSLVVGPHHAPLVLRQAVGHFETTPQQSLGGAAALAEEEATRRAFLRCAELLVHGAPAAPAPAAPAAGPLEACFASLGLGAELAAHLAALPGERAIPADLANQLWRTARQLLGRARAHALWRELGVRDGQLPRGTQAQLYAAHLNPHAHQEATP
ncbi:MAG: hypothetical protein AB7N76_19450 [Planctomycetota bacterium]